MKATLGGTELEYDVRGDGAGSPLPPRLPPGPVHVGRGGRGPLAAAPRGPLRRAGLRRHRPRTTTRSRWSGSPTTAPPSWGSSGSRRRSWRAARWGATPPSPSSAGTRERLAGPRPPGHAGRGRHRRGPGQPGHPRGEGPGRGRGGRGRGLPAEARRRDHAPRAPGPRREPPGEHPRRVAAGDREGAPRPRRPRRLARDAAHDPGADAGRGGEEDVLTPPAEADTMAAAIPGAASR